LATSDAGRTLRPREEGAFFRHLLRHADGGRGQPFVGGAADGWFTEGFDTLDLKEAEALLDALA
jgi:hypothetical protein